MSRRLIEIIENTFSTFNSSRASQAAASLAYYAIFSLFPLLLVLIATGSYFLDSDQVYQAVTSFILSNIPAPPELINENLKQVLAARGTVGVIGIVTLLWSASAFFTSLAHNINLAWTGATRRDFLASRVVGLGMIAGLVGLLVLSFSLSWIASLISIVVPEGASYPTLGYWRLISELGSWLITFWLFFTMYRWIPTVEVDRKAASWGALFATLAWKTATTAFGWYLSSGLGNYQLVYGSLGTIVALLFLIFILSLMTLLGAHFTSAIDQSNEETDQR